MSTVAVESSGGGMLRRLVRRILSGDARAALWRGYSVRRNAIDHALARWASRSPLRATMYYALLSPAFRREQFAVLNGRVRYEESVSSPVSSPFLLRRNIHRLEKGLIMRPRRATFATEYIEDTVECYVRQMTGASRHPGGLSADEMEWAGRVLEQYFAVANGDVAIDRGRERFLAAPRGPLNAPCDRPRAPYLRELSSPSPVRYDDLLELSRRRRSVRWFLPHPVDRAAIDRAVEVAVLSPSACNRQPYEFRIFDDPEQVRRVASVPMGTRGFSDNFPAVVVVIGRQRAYPKERDRHVIYIDASLAVMAFLYALEAQGLSSCCINWPDMEPQEGRMAKLLDLAPDERVVMLVAIGHPDPDGLVPASQKKPIDAARVYSGEVKG